MKIPYLSIKQRFLLLAAAALLFGLTPAVHAEGLSGLKDSLNKGEIDSATIEQTKQQSDISDIPQNSTSADKPAAKLQAPVKKVQIKKPARIKDVQVKKSSSRLKRIGAPIKTPDKDSYSFSISAFPVIDESKYNPEAIKALKAMREKATGYGNVEYDMKDFCAKYPAYTELCNLGRLYVIQQKLKIGKTYDLRAQKYLEELTGEFVYGSNEVTAFINNEVKNAMIPVLNDYNNKAIERMNASAKKEVERFKKEISDMIANSVFKPADLEILKAHITWSYQKMIDAYLGMKITNDYNLAEAQKFIKEITAFYNSLPLKVTIKFQESPDKPPINKEISVTKDGRTFINYLYSYIEAKIQHCQYSTDDKEFNSILNGKSENANDMATFDDFIARINNQPAGEIAFTQAEKDAYLNNIENYRKNVGKIKQIYFRKEISYGKLPPDYIAKTDECILLIAEIMIADPENHDIKILTPPVKIKFSSNISEMSSEITLKKSAIAKEYCAIMGNKNANLWPINDKSDTKKESVACFRGEYGLKSPPDMYNNKYFKHQLGRSDLDPDIIAKKEAIKNSVSFLKSGGFEYIEVESNGQKIQMAVKNQADWFIITGHGNPTTGSIGELDKNELNSPVLINPRELIDENGISEYSDDLDVLILGSCGILNSLTNISNWQRVLPDGIILGYKGTVIPMVVNEALDELNKCTPENFSSKEKIALMWAQINSELCNKYNHLVPDMSELIRLYPHKKMFRLARHHACIVNGYYYYTDYYKYKYKPFSMKIFVNHLRKLKIPYEIPNE